MNNFGVALQFRTPQGLISAVRALKRRGYTRFETFSPFPIDDVEEVLHQEKSKLPAVAFLAGTIGAIGGFYLQYFYSVQQYPHNVGGRPLFSWPAFIPVTFELTILAAGVAVFAFFFFATKLPQPYHPLFNVPSFARVSDDRFFLCLEAADPLFKSTHTRPFLNSLGAEEIHDVPV